MLLIVLLLPFVVVNIDDNKDVIISALLNAILKLNRNKVCVLDKISAEQ